jgi:hypothetical protein
MKISTENIGNGIIRFTAEPQIPSEKNTPQFAIDLMVEDAIKQESARLKAPIEKPKANKPHYETTTTWDKPSYGIPEPIEKIIPEPDGIDIHVDRPLRKEFGSFAEWHEAMLNYRELERLAHVCDWPCKEPMKGVAEDAREWKWERIPDYIDVDLDVEFEREPEPIRTKPRSKRKKLTADDIVDIFNLLIDKLD